MKITYLTTLDDYEGAAVGTIANHPESDEIHTKTTNGIWINADNGAAVTDHGMMRRGIAHLLTLTPDGMILGVVSARDVEKVFDAGVAAYRNGESIAPAANATVRAWLEANNPTVGDPRTTRIMQAFTDGVNAQREDAKDEL